MCKVPFVQNILVLMQYRQVTQKEAISENTYIKHFFLDIKKNIELHNFLNEICAYIKYDG